MSIFYTASKVFSCLFFIAQYKLTFFGSYTYYFFIFDSMLRFAEFQTVEVYIKITVPYMKICLQHSMISMQSERIGETPVFLRLVHLNTHPQWQSL